MTGRLTRIVCINMHPPRSLLSVVVLGATLLICACGGSGTTRIDARPQGTLAGTLGVYGGLETAHLCGCFMEAGTLRLTTRSGRVRYVQVGKSGRFAAAVLTGDYRVVAGLKAPMHWPMGSCRLFSPTSAGRRLAAKSYIHVSASQVTRVHVGCIGA